MKILLALLFVLFLANAGDHFEKENTLKVYYNPGCGCCNLYFSSLERQGFKIERIKVDNSELDRIKNMFNIPLNLRSCHTMEYHGKFIEGHVKPEGIRKVLKEKNIKGVAATHGNKSARGGFEDSYFVVDKEDRIKEIK